MENKKVLSQGAEGKIYITTFLDKKCLVKERFVKEYRVKELDTKLTKSRILNESRNISRASILGINVPTIYFIDLLERKIYMEYIENGCQLKEILSYIFELKDLNPYEELLKKIINDLGNIISKLHSNDIVHGDLTPSNIIIKKKVNNNNNENEDDNIEKIINEINEENNIYISYSHVKIALKSIRLWRLFFIGLTISPLSSIIRVTYRPIGIKKQIETQKLQLIGYSGFLVNCFFSPLFGYLSDKIQYKHVYCVITFLSGALGISYFYSFSIPNLFVFLTLFNSVIFISTKSFNPIHVMKTFGMKHYVEINGIINISSGIMEPLSSVFAFFIEKTFTDDNRDMGYKIIFISTGVLCFIGMILSFFEDEKKEYEK